MAQRGPSWGLWRLQPFPICNPISAPGQQRVKYVGMTPLLLSALVLPFYKVWRKNRVRKRRCLPVSSDLSGPCQLCQSLDASCSLVERSSVALSRQGIELISTTQQNNVIVISSLPPLPVIKGLVTLYFRVIHDGPHTLFHEPTLQAEISSNITPRVILLSIIAISARQIIRSSLIINSNLTFYSDSQKMHSSKTWIPDCGVVHMPKKQCVCLNKI